jgi:dolichol kinase
MEPNLKFEIKRKFIHIFALLYIGIYLYFANRFNHNIGLLSLTIVLAFFLVLEYFRVLKQKRIPVFHIFWRESEKNRLGGQVYFIIGAIIAFGVFDKNIAITALLMTIFGDMAAATRTAAYGRGGGIGSSGHRPLHWVLGVHQHLGLPGHRSHIRGDGPSEGLRRLRR